MEAETGKREGKVTPKKKKDAMLSKRKSNGKNCDATGGEEGKLEVNFPRFYPLLHSDTQGMKFVPSSFFH